MAQMSHMVIYLSADGKAGYQQVDDLGAAVAFVERIRNTQGIENSRIYRMEQVNYRFEPYYQVRLETGELLGGPYAATSSETSASWQATSGPAPASAGSARAPGTSGSAAVASADPAAAPGVSPATAALGDPAPAAEPGDGNGSKRGLLR